jgi:hypothetical protein
VPDYKRKVEKIPWMLFRLMMWPASGDCVSSLWNSLPYSHSIVYLMDCRRHWYSSICSDPGLLGQYTGTPISPANIINTTQASVR